MDLHGGILYVLCIVASQFESFYLFFEGSYMDSFYLKLLNLNMEILSVLVLRSLKRKYLYGRWTSELKFHVDGASRGNSGLSRRGCIIRDHKSNRVSARSLFIS